jgi:hypothetical protein
VHCIQRAVVFCCVNALVLHRSALGCLITQRQTWMVGPEYTWHMRCSCIKVGGAEECFGGVLRERYASSHVSDVDEIRRCI